MLKGALHHLGIRIARPIYGGVGSIIALHRVIPESQRSLLSVNRALEITPGDLGEILQFFKEEGVEFVPMDAVPDRLRSPRRRRFAAVTLDDGYRDNVEHALPVFADHDVPFTVYATRGFSEHRESVWWFSLEEALLERAALTVQDPSSAETFPLPNDEAREAAFSVLARRIRTCGLEERERLLTAIFGAAGVDPLKATRELILTSDELVSLAKHPLATIGAHTVHHLTPSVLDEGAAGAEFSQCKEWLEQITGKPVRHLAYPFGGANAVGRREFAIARECGFTTAVTTRFANLFPAHMAAPWALPRLEISGNYRARAFTERAVSGLLPALRNGGRRVVIE